MAAQAGKQMKRVKLPDGTSVILPMAAVMAQPLPPNMTVEDLLKELKKPLGGTW